ncbi:MAG TPA: glycosyltransferase family 2 protein [Humisphaera sp.]|jgi:glycosyltransferase involved in cell wall biosynthesis|nr:glycosyltransferase family 2 protein [Humisphaera sp.]
MTQAATADPVLIEVMIPTFNEMEHITEVVANARELGPVFVLDSCSKDGTQDLARQAGATVVEHPFVDYADQKNWGLANLPFRGQWILILDADERITPQLCREIQAKIRGNSAAAGYYINRVLLFMGRAVRHGGLYPSWNLRLFRRGAARYENRSVHEHVICDGPTEYLRGELLHIRRENIWQYLEKHIRYADMESSEWIKARTGQGGGAPSRSLFRDALRYRQWLRRKVWPRLPFRPLWRWAYMYIFRLGFLDGRAGWHLARLMACYEYMISLLYNEKLGRIREPELPAQQRAASRSSGPANNLDADAA